MLVYHSICYHVPKNSILGHDVPFIAFVCVLTWFFSHPILGKSLLISSIVRTPLMPKKIQVTGTAEGARVNQGNTSQGIRIKVQYGLFTGTTTYPNGSYPLKSKLPMNLPSSICPITEMFWLFFTKLPVTCSPTKNICFQSCQPTEASRDRELLLLLYGHFRPNNCNGTNPILLEYPLPGANIRKKSFINYTLYMAAVYLLGICIFLCLLAVLSTALSLALKFRNQNALLRW